MKMIMIDFTISDVFSIAKQTRDVVAGKALKWALKEISTLNARITAQADSGQGMREEISYLRDQLGEVQARLETLRSEAVGFRQKIAQMQIKYGEVKLTSEEEKLLSGPCEKRQKIEAIKSVRARTCLGLKEAKAMCDMAEAEMDKKNPAQEIPY